jgi:TfoX/Sxy family transcriptional regulator of competence genes
MAARRGERGSDSLIEHLHDVIADIVRGFGPVEKKKMLVSQGWHTGGKVFTLVNRDARIVVRITDPSAQKELLAIRGAAGWQFGDKPPQKAWLLLPEFMHEDHEALASWLRRAYDLTRALQKTAKKPRKAKARQLKKTGQAAGPRQMSSSDTRRRNPSRREPK